MRRSLIGSFGPLAVTGLLALASASGAIAEDTEFENVETDGSQIIPAGLPGEAQQTKNLNTVPEDGLGPETTKGPNNRLVRQLMAARPNEDLIICIAGCFSGRDRVVYAQPMEKRSSVHPSAMRHGEPQSSLPEANRQHLSAMQPGDGTRPEAGPAVAPGMSIPPPAATDTAPAAPAPQASAARSLDPQAPAILNSGAASNDASAAPDTATDPSNETPANADGNPTN